MIERGDPGPAHTERTVAGILRALGQLLLALAGQGEHGVAEPLGREPRFAPPPVPEADAGEDVELLLADARARAHELIEESVRRAQEVLQRRAQPAAGPPEPLRRTVASLAADVRGLHRRIDGLEALLRVALAAPGAPVPAAAEPSAPLEPAAEPAPPAAAAEPAASVEPSAAPVTPPEAATAAPAVGMAAATPGVPVTPDAAAPAPPPPTAAPEPVPTPANGARLGPAVVFAAGEGTVVLRIAPVAGFQGLMRVQDALGQVPGVREAGVEAYAQGEARLRLQLAGSLDSERLATVLSGLLGREARLAAASLTDRSITMTLD